MLRSLLQRAESLHRLGYVHRDFKPENVLLDGSASEPAGVVQLIDMGSCALVEGCGIVDSLLGRCTGYDARYSPCSPLYAPPEQFVDSGTPFGFDVYSIGICFLQLCWSGLGSD